jgi:signal peptidase II
MNKRYGGYFFLFTIIFLSDFFSKQWAFFKCQSPLFINSFLTCFVTINRGISWSLFDSENSLIFSLLTFCIAVVIIMLAFYIFNRWKQQSSLGGEICVLAGALANFIDRCLHGGVIDFITINYKSFIFPIFNIADIAIVVGVFYMLWKAKK